MGSDEDRDLWGAKEERDHPAFCSEQRWAATLLKAASRARERERGRWGEERGMGKGTAGNLTRRHSTGTPQIFAKGMICFPSNWKPSTPIYNTQLLSSRKGGGAGGKRAAGIRPAMP